MGLTEEHVEDAIAYAEGLWDPVEPYRSIRKFFFVLATPHPGAAPAQYFAYKQQYEVDLEAAALQGWDSLEDAMRDIGNRLRRHAQLQQTA